MNLTWQNLPLTRIYNPEFNFYKRNSSKSTNSEDNFHYQAKRNPLLWNHANNKLKTMNHKLQNCPTKLRFKKVRFKDLIKPWEKNNLIQLKKLEDGDPKLTNYKKTCQNSQESMMMKWRFSHHWNLRFLILNRNSKPVNTKINNLMRSIKISQEDYNKVKEKSDNTKWTKKC